MDTERALELGRQVIIADLVAVHPGQPDRCLCKGSGEVTYIFQGKTGTKMCGVAEQAFAKVNADRFVNMPAGPFWRRGMAPEDWPFVLMFQADRREFRWRSEFRQRVGPLP